MSLYGTPVVQEPLWWSVVSWFIMPFALWGIGEAWWRVEKLAPYVAAEPVDRPREKVNPLHYGVLLLEVMLILFVASQPLCLTPLNHDHLQGRVTAVRQWGRSWTLVYVDTRAAPWSFYGNYVDSFAVGETYRVHVIRDSTYLTLIGFETPE